MPTIPNDTTAFDFTPNPITIGTIFKGAESANVLFLYCLSKDEKRQRAKMNTLGTENPANTAELMISLLLHRSTWPRYPHTAAVYARNAAFSVCDKKRIVETNGIVRKLESSKSQNTTSVAKYAKNVAMFPTRFNAMS
tara:strand:+ start:100 stop:513 length:414 start_codon:yes stop_codon:yes gene_type:complete